MCGVVRRGAELDGVITLIVAVASLLLGRLGVATFKATGTGTEGKVSTDGVLLMHAIGAEKEVSKIAEVPRDEFNDVLHPRTGVVSLPNDILVWRIGVASLHIDALLWRIGVLSLHIEVLLWRIGVVSLPNDVLQPRIGVVSLEQAAVSKVAMEGTRDMIGDVTPADIDPPNEGIEATGAVHEP